MSYGIFLHRDAPLSAAERRAVRAALARWGWDGSPGSPYQIGTPDGITVECYASKLDADEPFHHISLEVRGFSLDLCRLVLDLARTGRFSVSHDGDPAAVILADETHRRDLPPDVPADAVMVCDTPEELEAALDGGFDTWKAYRDRVIPNTGESA